MNIFMNFMISYGEYVAFVYIPVVLFSILYALVCLKLINMIFALCDYFYKVKKSIVGYIKWRLNISKLVRHFKMPMEETTYYPDGTYKTRKYYF